MTNRKVFSGIVVAVCIVIALIILTLAAFVGGVSGSSKMTGKANINLITTQPGSNPATQAVNSLEQAVFDETHFIIRPQFNRSMPDSPLKR